MTRKLTLPIARELLEVEHERLLRDHYDTAPKIEDARRYAPCDLCARALAVRLELERIAR